jgi:hypothetical protein
MKHDIEEIVKEFEEKAKKLFTHGGLCDVLDYPPHEQVLDEKEVAEFIRSQFPKYATQQIEAFRDYVEHRSWCIRSQLEGGRPTEGGYEDKYNGVWYEARPIDKTPKCDCGLDEILIKSLPTNKK